jgi:hypothetical protein
MTLEVSRQGWELLEALATHGIYGVNSKEVAERLLDRALLQFAPPPKLKLRRAKR